MKNEVVIRHRQRNSRHGLVNVLTVNHGRVAGREPGSFEIDFEHVGTEFLPAPSFLDGYVFGLLFFALQGADRMIVEGSVSASAIRNAWSLGEAWNAWIPEKYRPFEIVADTASIADGMSTPVGVAEPQRSSAIAAFSGGVDSMHTALRHSKGLLGNASHDLRDLCIVHGFDVGLDKSEDFARLTQRLTPFVKDVGCQLHVVRTNIRSQTSLDWEHSHISQIACVLHQFSHSHTYGLVASGDSYFRFPPLNWGSSPMTDHYYSGSQFQLELDGSASSRFDKVKLLADHPPSHQLVQVCYTDPERDRNCGVCVKCLRTRINFLAAGIDHPETFGGSLTTEDIEGIHVDTPAQLHNFLSVIDFVREKKTHDPRFDVLERKINELSGLILGSASLAPGRRQPSLDFQRRLSEYRESTWNLLVANQPVWLLVDMAGNVGDHLIWMGTEKMLEGIPTQVRRISTLDLEVNGAVRRPGTLVIPGSGAFTRHFHSWLPQLVYRAAEKFDRIVILASEYDAGIPAVSEALSRANVFAIARDRHSYALSKAYGRAALGLDPALYAFAFEPAPDRDMGRVLLSLRTDDNSRLSHLGMCPARGNNDISATSIDLLEFLASIRRVDTVVTDRLHVAVAGVMLGKRICYVDPHNEKISRYAEFNFRDEFGTRLLRHDEAWLVDQGYAVAL